MNSKEIQNKLLGIGEQIKVKYKAEFEQLKKKYTQAVLKLTPEHMRKAVEYEIQFIFYSDCWFLVHCITTLLNNGKLKIPTEEQKKSLSTLIAYL